MHKQPSKPQTPTQMCLPLSLHGNVLPEGSGSPKVKHCKLAQSLALFFYWTNGGDLMVSQQGEGAAAPFWPSSLHVPLLLISSLHPPPSPLLRTSFESHVQASLCGSGGGCHCIVLLEDAELKSNQVSFSFSWLLKQRTWAFGRKWFWKLWASSWGEGEPSARSLTFDLETKLIKLLLWAFRSVGEVLKDFCRIQSDITADVEMKVFLCGVSIFLQSLLKNTNLICSKFTQIKTMVVISDTLTIAQTAEIYCNFLLTTIFIIPAVWVCKQHF